MKILVLFAHPLLEKSHINRELVKVYADIEQLTFHDLYERYPEFDIDIEFEKNLLVEHDLIIFHHPFYWYSCPPLMKQWIDMVLEVGWAYGNGGFALQNKMWFQVISAGGMEKAYDPEGHNRYSIREYLRPFEQTARLCRMKYLPPYVVFGTHRLSREELNEHITNLKEGLRFLKNEGFPGCETDNSNCLNKWIKSS
jgi:glutathione-regulated potassium-efflux system ancillary protein KefG